MYCKTINYYTGCGHNKPYKHQLIEKSSGISPAQSGLPVITLFIIFNTKQEVHVQCNFTICIHFP